MTYAQNRRIRARLRQAPRCAEHDTDMVWLDGSLLPGYADDFRPVGWSCPCDPGHRRPAPPLSGREQAIVNKFETAPNPYPCPEPGNDWCLDQTPCSQCPHEVYT